MTGFNIRDETHVHEIIKIYIKNRKKVYVFAKNQTFKFNKFTFLHDNL